MQVTRAVVRDTEELAIRLNEELEHVGGKKSICDGLINDIGEFRFEKHFEKHVMNFNEHKRCIMNRKKSVIHLHISYRHVSSQICSQLNQQVDQDKQKYSQKLEYIQVRSIHSNFEQSSSSHLDTLL